MVTKTKNGTAITALCMNAETEELSRLPIFVDHKVKSARACEKLCKEKAEAMGLLFIKADMEYVKVKFTMSEEEFYAKAEREVI